MGSEEMSKPFSAATVASGNNTTSAPIALNPQVRGREGALLSALLQATDYAILMSTLDRQDLVANRRMGEMFDLAPHEIVEMAPEPVRALARARFRDPEAF